MAIPITVPRLGWDMEQGVFVGWLKADGATVRAGEALFTLESDKATEDVEGFEDGILHIPADGPNKGDVVAVGTVIGFVLQAGEAIPVAGEPTASPQASKAAVADTPSRRTTTATRDRPASSPRARRTAANLGVDWRNAKASGSSGRIRERDVLALAPATSSTRRVIAERMVTSHRSTAPVTLTTTVDATNLVTLRAGWKAASEDGGDILPTFTDLLVKLAAIALEKHPVLNSRWQDDRIVFSEGIHIGIAVDTGAGLLVPVVRDVPRLSLKELATQSRVLVERVRRRKLTATEMQGGVSSVTSVWA